MNTDTGGCIHSRRNDRSCDHPRMTGAPDGGGLAVHQHSPPHVFHK